eukprot:7463899-Pyramimonas_sp.AAC.1
MGVENGLGWGLGPLNVQPWKASPSRGRGCARQGRACRRFYDCRNESSRGAIILIDMRPFVCDIGFHQLDSLICLHNVLKWGTQSSSGSISPRSAMM